MENVIHDDELDIRTYELGFHIVPMVGDAGVSAEVDAVRTLIESRKGVILSEDFPVLISLAYPMQKDINRKRHTCESTYFGWIRFEASAADAHAIKEAVAAQENILRHLITKIDRNAPVRKYAVTRTSRDSTPEEEHAYIPERKSDDSDTEVKHTMTTEQMDAEIEKLVV